MVQTDGNNLHTQLELSEKGCAINELIVFLVLSSLIPCGIEGYTLQITRRESARWRVEDLYLYLASKRGHQLT